MCVGYNIFRMRLCLVMSGVDGGLINLPIHYNHLVQAFIYNNLSKDLANFLHDRGLLYGNRAFKFFTFSRLQGEYFINNKRIIYRGDISLYISSPLKRFINELANNIVKNEIFYLGDNVLRITKLVFPQEPKIGESVRIRMLSPLTVYSTLFTVDGKRKTYYYTPYEEEFSRLVNLNAKKKYFVIYKRNIKSNLRIKPLKVREVMVMYKDTVVKGWVGEFVLNGPKTLLRLLYDTGLGSKNSQGFGMFDVIN